MKKKSFKKILNSFMVECSKPKVTHKSETVDVLSIKTKNLVSEIQMLKQIKQDGTVIKLPESFKTEEAVSRYYQDTHLEKKRIVSCSS